MHSPQVLVRTVDTETCAERAAVRLLQISPAKNDREYWQRVMPEALAEHDQQVRHHCHAASP